MEFDFLAIGAHPDDVELAAGGTVARLVAEGKQVALLDLTRGELGTRGSAELRDREAAAAASMLGVTTRLNAGLPDGALQDNDEQRRVLVRYIRHLRPRIVLGNAHYDRHPDHGNAAKLIKEACFLAGLRRIETEWEGVPQGPFRPQKLYHYVQDHWIHPSFVVDITDYLEAKLQAIRAYGSQFYNPESKEPETYISRPEFWEHITARAREHGHLVNVRYGEGFVSDTPLLYMF